MEAPHGRAHCQFFRLSGHFLFLPGWGGGKIKPPERNHLLQDGTAMPNNNERPRTEVTPSAPSLKPMPANGPITDEPEAGSQAQQSGHVVADRDLTVELKRGLEETRLPADLREQILAELPPPEERERLFRELQETGGLSSEQFLAALGLEVEPKS
jgi:hypothetical protein